jgi:uncharacterized caspase-like protein
VVPARAEEHVLVVSSDYEAAGNPDLFLANPDGDGDRVLKAFEKAGQRDVARVSNPDIQSWNEAIDKFVAKLGRDDVAIFFFAGHAVQYQGENYLLANDGVTFINFNSIVQQINGAAQASVFIIDACRSNPFAEASGSGRALTLSSLERAGRSRQVATINIQDLQSTRAGLAQLSDLRGLSTVVFFSTEPGNVALDGEAGKGSPFASILAREIQKRQSLDSLLKRTAAQVHQQTGGRQSPWRQGDIPFDIFFAGKKAFAIP